jgi:hypothetical protein
MPTTAADSSYGINLLIRTIPDEIEVVWTDWDFEEPGDVELTGAKIGTGTFSVTWGGDLEFGDVTKIGVGTLEISATGSFAEVGEKMVVDVIAYAARTLDETAEVERVLDVTAEVSRIIDVTARVTP